MRLPFRVRLGERERAAVICLPRLRTGKVTSRSCSEVGTWLTGSLAPMSCATHVDVPLQGLFPLPPTRSASVAQHPDSHQYSSSTAFETRRGAIIMEIRLAAQKSVTPQLHLRRRRCTSAHRKALVGLGSQRSGPGSLRRRPAAAGRLHRNPPNLYGSGGWGRKYLRGPRSVQLTQSSFNIQI
jgi:hypothetical protein